ncbi:hypothetical protein CCMSSC00406_0009999 [Pleurotus cornucopiae]|uniref:Uncharacterized protein n=1 Tax=Pleurotus cornucopiae TaxID=5321 RepID=A0ACB7J8Y7_PLECO|nr:hypothetical protein CCMSSC00406_0009999 [Pleurotus cornucopiae]
MHPPFVATASPSHVAESCRRRSGEHEIEHWWVMPMLNTSLTMIKCSPRSCGIASTATTVADDDLGSGDDRNSEGVVTARIGKLRSESNRRREDGARRRKPEAADDELDSSTNRRDIGTEEGSEALGDANVYSQWRTSLCLDCPGLRAW